VDPRSVRRTLADRSGCERIVPRSCSAAKSCGRVSISSRGRGPRPAVRPTGACDREPGARPGRGVRPSSSCGRESRAPWRGDASWAGRSASSSLPGILSIRPRGPVRRRPSEGTQTRRSPETRAGAFSVRRIIGGGRPDRQTFGPRHRPATDAPADPGLCSRTAKGAASDTPREYREFALRALGGGATVRPPKTRRAAHPPSRALGRRPQFPPSRQTVSVAPEHESPIDLWTRSRSGAPHSASSR
jgi:hypothetical protein